MERGNEDDIFILDSNPLNEEQRLTSALFRFIYGDILSDISQELGRFGRVLSLGEWITPDPKNDRKIFDEIISEIPGQVTISDTLLAENWGALNFIVTRKNKQGIEKARENFNWVAPIGMCSLIAGMRLEATPDPSCSFEDLDQFIVSLRNPSLWGRFSQVIDLDRKIFSRVERF